MSHSSLQYDRFIPNRAAMDLDVAQYLMGDSKNEKPAGILSPSQEAYRKRLAEVCLKNRTRILAFKSKPPEPAEKVSWDVSSSLPQPSRTVKPRRHIPQSAERTLDAPDLVDDYYLNLLDWSSNGVLAIALSHSLYLWDASEGTVSELMSIDENNGPITSISWAPDGKHIAVGLNNSAVQLWDATATKQLRTLRGGHQSRVGSLAWNSHILTTGGKDGLILNNDVRIRSHIVEEYKGHEQEVCGLKWSSSGQQLASGGNDNLLHIWDRTMASEQNAGQNQWLHRLDDHRAAVKALAWCPFQGNLLASGGGGSDRCIKFWNTHTGSCLNSVDTGSQVCALLWSKTERELLSSHGFDQNQLTLWKYPSMVKMTELTGHTSRVLFMAQSPDGCTVASASAGDETLRFWNVFGNPETNKKPVSKPLGPFASVNSIR
ncbi:unnamed protein product [Victoria cruziana]